MQGRVSSCPGRATEPAQPQRGATGTKARRTRGGAPLGLSHAVHVPAARGALQVLRATRLSACPACAKDRAGGRWAAGRRPGQPIAAVSAATRRRAAAATPSDAAQAASGRRLRSTAPLRRRVCSQTEHSDAPSSRRTAKSPSCTPRCSAPRAHAQSGAPARAASPAPRPQRSSEHKPFFRRWRGNGVSVSATSSPARSFTSLARAERVLSHRGMCCVARTLLGGARRQSPAAPHICSVGDARPPIQRAARRQSTPVPAHDRWQAC